MKTNRAAGTPTMLAVCLCVALAACATSSVRDPDDGPPRVLCNGSTSIRFMFRAVSLWPGPDFAYENGASLLMVTGTCDYWVFNPPAIPDSIGRTADVYTGHLTAERAQSIADRLRYDGIAALAGDYRVHPDAAGYDEYITDGTNVVLCNNVLCLHGDAPVRGMYLAVRDISAELHDTGTPVTGDIWYEIVDRSGMYPISSADAVEWPFSIPLVPGRGRVAPPDAASLRELRARLRAGEFLRTAAFVPARVGDGPVFAVFLRDSLPFEDEEGHVPLAQGDAGL